MTKIYYVAQPEITFICAQRASDLDYVTAFHKSIGILDARQQNLRIYLNFLNEFTMFRIHDILVWIWIRGSMPLNDVSGFGYRSCYFRY